MLGDCFICCRDRDFDITKQAISSTGTCGSSKNLDIAKIKAISEFVEREACTTSGAKSSTGFAAYPYIFNSNKSKFYAKENAYFEMLERYALYQWVNTNGIKNTVSNDPYEFNKKFYSGIQKEITILEYHKITPKLSNVKNIVFVIIYVKTQLGWAFGCAANKCPNKAEQNALKELYMHCIGLYRMKIKKISPKTNLEKQTIWISHQDDIIKEKIKSEGTQLLSIPQPLFKSINSKYQNCFMVEQCYFKDFDHKPSTNYKRLYI